MELLFNKKIEIELNLKKCLSYIRNKRIQDASAHIINAGGKRIRPSLLYLAYKAVGGKDDSRIIPIATAIEFFHTWTLIHDDIIDRSEVRRSVPTVHIKWDKNTALLAGDALNNLVYLSLVKNIVDKDIILKIVGIIAEASLDLIDGEMMDVEFEKRVDLTEDEYFEMIKKKTGSVIKCAVSIGAMLGTEDEEKIKALEEYGELVGIAFQIQDDLLDLVGDKGELGKDIGRDIKEGKRTLMEIHALNNADSKDANRLMDIRSAKNPSGEEIQVVMNILKKNGSLEYTQQTSSKLIRKAKETLNILPQTEYKTGLLELADFIVGRKN